MRTITLRDRIRYRFEATMSRGPAPLIGWLFLLSLLLVVAVSLFVFLTRADPNQRTFLQIAWASLLRTLDPGTMGGDTGSWPFLLSMLAVTLGGVFVVSILIGILTTGIEGRLEQLRRGRGFVAETGHTLILGWTPQVFTILSELTIANENQARQCIVLLADQDKAEMEDAIRSRVESRGRTRIVCRTGEPIDRADLEIVNPDGARSIIVLPADEQAPDAYVLKAILALLNKPNRRQPYHIVSVVRGAHTLEAARSIVGQEALLIPANDLIARIAAQTCRQSGLSVVYTELMDFGGDEIYFQEEPALVGRAFGEALLCYEDSALMGLRFPDGRVQLNPPMDVIIGPGDKIIAVSADDDTVRLSGKAAVDVDEEAIREPDARALEHPLTNGPERTLILGWNRRAPQLVAELDHYVDPGSEVTVVASESDLGDCPSPAELTAQPFQNLAVTFRSADATERRVLDELDIQSFQHVLVLAYCDALEPQRADARTLITLLHLRNIAERCGHTFSLVSEMLDVRNRDLAEAARADDFIVSDRLVSLMLAQLSENKGLWPVYQDLFDPEGAEIYLKPAGNYVQLGRPVSFYTVVEAARRRREVALGYRCSALAYDPGQAYGIRLNPAKSDRVAFDTEDRIIVLAES